MIQAVEKSSRVKPALRVLRRELARCALVSGLPRLGQTLKGRRHAILTFHRVRPCLQPHDHFDTCPCIATKMFRSMVEYVGRHFDVVPLCELAGRNADAPPAAAITFDDGWRDNYDLAFPILKQLGLPATIFVTTGKIGNSQAFWQQSLGRMFHRAIEGTDRECRPRLAEVLGLDAGGTLTSQIYRSTVVEWKTLTEADRRERLRRAGWVDEHDAQEERCFLTCEEIREMAGAGIDFGSHAVNHAILTQLTPAETRAELTESKATLETILGRGVETLAYPNGDCSDEVVRCAQAAGYRIGCTTRNARISDADHPLRLPRLAADWHCAHPNNCFDQTMFGWQVR